MMALVHGHTRRLGSKRASPSPEYRAYVAMKNRVLNKQQERYMDYGGRGIKICDRWLRGENGRPGFLCFLQDIGKKPGPEYSLDRIDNDGDYCPKNVRWATRVQQARNTRTTHLVGVCGIEIPLIDAATRWGAVSYGTAKQRIFRGWPAEDAIFVPKGGKPSDIKVEVPF